jgi:hypothetical protein
LPRQIERSWIEPHWIKGGEPAHGSGQVNIGENLFAPVPLHIKQDRIAAASHALPSRPLRTRYDQASQQHIVDAAVKCCGHLCQ